MGLGMPKAKISFDFYDETLIEPRRSYLLSNICLINSPVKNFMTANFISCFCFMTYMIVIPKKAFYERVVEDR